MNKYITLIVIFLLSFTTLTFGNISLFFDGEEVNFEHQPVIVEERVFYPMRELVELFGGSVTWNQSTQTATTKAGDNVVEFTLNSNEYVLNGETLFMEDNIVPVVVNQSIYLPIRYLAESLSFLVGWDYDKQAISVDSEEYYLANPDFAEENDKYILSAYLQYLNTISELLSLIDSSENNEDKKFYTTTTLSYIENVDLPEASPKIKIYSDLLNTVENKTVNACNQALTTGDYDIIDSAHAEIIQIIRSSNSYEFFSE